MYQILEQMFYLLNKKLLNTIYRILDLNYAFSCNFVLYVKLFVYIVIFIFCVSGYLIVIYCKVPSIPLPSSPSHFFCFILLSFQNLIHNFTSDVYKHLQNKKNQIWFNQTLCRLNVYRYYFKFHQRKKN